MQKLTIIKVGGKVVEEHETLTSLLNDFAKLDGHKLLVHGGGRSATKVAEKLGIETIMVDGRRVTDRATLDVVTMVYGGLVNKHIVAGLQAKGINSLGVTGADLNLILAKKRPVKEVDYGFVGDVVSVQTDVISKLIESGIVPVVAPLTHDGQGNMLNTNADTMASSLAVALAKNFEVTLAYCFEKPGVMTDQDDENSVIPSLTFDVFKQHQATGVINSGMIPKLDNGFDAIKAGVKRVIITNPQGIGANFSTGTILE